MKRAGCVGGFRPFAASCRPLIADPDVRVRPAFRLSPLALWIGLSLSAQAQNMPDDFSLCPVTDAIPPFHDAPDRGSTTVFLGFGEEH